MKYEVRKACNVFMYGNFVELEWIEPLPMGPLEPEHACNEVDCIECWNRGVNYTAWRKVKRSERL